MALTSVSLTTQVFPPSVSNLFEKSLPLTSCIPITFIKSLSTRIMFVSMFSPNTPLSFLIAVINFMVDWPMVVETAEISSMLLLFDNSVFIVGIFLIISAPFRVTTTLFSFLNPSGFREIYRICIAMMRVQEMTPTVMINWINTRTFLNRTLPFPA